MKYLILLSVALFLIGCTESHTSTHAGRDIVNIDTDIKGDENVLNPLSPVDNSTEDNSDNSDNSTGGAGEEE